MQTINIPLSLACYTALSNQAASENTNVERYTARRLSKNLQRFNMDLWTTIYPEVLTEYKLSEVPGALRMVALPIDDDLAYHLQQISVRYNVIKAELARWCLAKHLD